MLWLVLHLLSAVLNDLEVLAMITSPSITLAELIQSVTTDPQKVFQTLNTCSIVLFKSPASLSNISTNSDLILKTQRSLDQVTPFIGSKAFGSLKLWATIRTLGRDGMENLIDARLALTRQLQDAIRAHPDLILLSETDINSCMFIFVLSTCQKAVASTGMPLPFTDMEKLNGMNMIIKTHVTESSDGYFHGFNLKRCPNSLWQEEQQVYVLRIMNGNPLSTIEHARQLLAAVAYYSNAEMTWRQYKILDGFTNVFDLPIGKKMRRFIANFFGDDVYEALAYGSCRNPANKLLSDFDMMVFVNPSRAITAQYRADFEAGYRKIMKEENVLIDDEAPFAIKQIVRLSVAQEAASGASLHIIQDEIAPIKKNPDYLQSEEMAHRLIFNVLTVPVTHVSGEIGLTERLQTEASVTLVHLMQMLGGDFINAQTFANSVCSNGERSGEKYMGYKNRPDIVHHLRLIWEKTLLDTFALPPIASNLLPEAAPQSRITMKTMAQGCAVLLNGFPGVGKLAIARAVVSQLPQNGARLVDNHLLIDPAEAIIPGRGESHKKLRKELRSVAFQAIKNEVAAYPGLAFILTSCLARNPSDTAVLNEHFELAQTTRLPFYFINITCKEAEHKKRFGDAQRYKEGKMKLSDEMVLDDLMTKNELVDASELGSEATKGLELRYELLDTTHLNVQQSATAIMGIMGVSQSG